MADLINLLLKFMSRPGTYPIWLSDMISFKYLPTLSDIAFVIILRSHEEREIGLQFFMLCLSFPAFGIRLMQLVN